MKIKQLEQNKRLYDQCEHWLEGTDTPIPSALMPDVFLEFCNKTYADRKNEEIKEMEGGE